MEIVFGLLVYLSIGGVIACVIGAIATEQRWEDPTVTEAVIISILLWPALIVLCAMTVVLRLFGVRVEAR